MFTHFIHYYPANPDHGLHVLGMLPCVRLFQAPVRHLQIRVASRLHIDEVLRM